VLIDGADRHMNTIVPALLQGIQSPRALQGEILA
jgi:hypothetical protein